MFDESESYDARDIVLVLETTAPVASPLIQSLLETGMANTATTLMLNYTRVTPWLKLSGGILVWMALREGPAAEVPWMMPESHNSTVGSEIHREPPPHGRTRRAINL